MKAENVVDTGKAIAMLPGDGWVAIYRGECGEEFALPVFMWLLIPGEGIVPVDMDETGYSHPVWESVNFLRLQGPRAFTITGAPEKL
jgi:hypothetical protein